MKKQTQAVLTMELGKLQEIATYYKKWVMENPHSAAEMEAIVKWGSYIIAGRFRSSSLLCELVYSGSRLFELFNDFLIRSALPKLTQEQGSTVKVLLTILEYVEVLLEITAVQVWGEIGRWVVVSSIQLIKSVWRFILLVNHKIGMIPSPPVRPLNRRAANALMKQGYNNNCHLQENEVMRLPRSGRVIRTINGAPPHHQRTFVPPTVRSVTSPDVPRTLSKKQLTAEVLHILRPLSHLGSLYMFGLMSWKPWLVSLSFDLTSLHLHRGAYLSKEEQAELMRRWLGLLYYLVRSPAFHTVTHQRIKILLDGVGRRVPLARAICQPLLNYIPEWQKIYAYTWS
ncbi:peroxisomal biogenesis factor 16 [Oratosquilla oratoria]|uniref:peroxisomal biogenesis factor 16 n=1 Tax=Oratosquilla oratoria TaxID=337810 RepID=UPI003F75B3B6